MNIDFHVHGKLTKKSRFETDYFLTQISFAVESGLNAFVLSEHFNTDDYYDIVESLESSFEYEGDAYQIDGFKVFTGIEVDVEGGGHVILVSNRRTLMEIRRKLDHNTQKDSFLSFQDLMDLAQERQCLTIGAHPFRGDHPLALQDAAQLARLDAFDLNATDIYTMGLEKSFSQVQRLANELNIGMVCGSDTHYPIQLGSIRNIFEKDCSTAEELKDHIRARRFAVEISPVLNTKVFAAKTTKAYLKALKSV